MAERPFGDRVGGGEVLDRLVGPDVDEEGVDLDEFAGRLRLASFGQARGVALALIDAEAPAAWAPSESHQQFPRHSQTLSSVNLIPSP